MHNSLDQTPSDQAVSPSDKARASTSGDEQKCIDIQFRDRAQSPGSRFVITSKGFIAEHVIMRGAREYAFDVAGPLHYLAIHDLKLVDGEIALGDAAPQSRLDLRDRMTLAPADCRATGFASLADRTNSFTAMTYDPDLLAEEVDRSGWGTISKPMLYFRDPSLTATLTKLGDVLMQGDSSSSAYAETLGLLALFEVNRLQLRSSTPTIANSGGLSARQERQVRDYINDNLQSPLPLTEIAAVAGLTRFHFSRAFSRTFGTAPHQYIMQCRINRAKSLLAKTDLPIASIASRAGFKTPNHLSSAFRTAVGCTPSEFRRSL